MLRYAAFCYAVALLLPDAALIVVAATMLALRRYAAFDAVC